MSNSGPIHYRQQVSFCGKTRCQKCHNGIGHGPYWYAYQTVNGETKRTYIGRQLPPDIHSSDTQATTLLSSRMSSLSTSASIRITTLGQFYLERRRGPQLSSWQKITEPTWQHQRVRGVLICLLGSDGYRLGREQIMDALWPDLDLETVASRLDRAVYDLRQLFEPERERKASSPLLLTDRDVLTLADSSHIWIDVDAFEQLVERGHEASEQGKLAEAEHLLEEAMKLYKGDFLLESSLSNVLRRREALRHQWTGLLLDLTDLHIRRESFPTAIKLLDRLITLDPANEAAAQRLISLLAHLGRRSEAVRTYKRLSLVLQQKYQMAPLPATRHLYETVRRGNEVERERALLQPRARITQHGNGVARENMPGHIGRVHTTALIGREQDWTHLCYLVDEIENLANWRFPGQKHPFPLPKVQNIPHGVSLLGEIGIGKTRLAEEVSNLAHRRGFLVMWNRSYSLEGSISYGLWIDMLRKAMHQGIFSLEGVKGRPLLFQPLLEVFPELDLPDISPPGLERGEVHFREAIYELLVLICARSPLLIMLDDLQWADTKSCELIAYLLRRVINQPILFVLTYRREECPPNHPLCQFLPELESEGLCLVLSCLPLSDEQISALLSSFPDLPQSLLTRICAHAAGNPFLAEELAYEAKSRLAEEERAIEVEHLLPQTIAAALDLRLERLSSPCQQLLAKAAVLGQAFTFRTLSQIELNSGGPFNEEVILGLLEEALRAGMLIEEDTGTDITYHFWHPLLVSHLSLKLSAARRALLHRRAASVFCWLYSNSPEEGAPLITHHLICGGGEAREIARYTEISGNRSYVLSAYMDAEKFYRQALAHLGDQAGAELRAVELLELLGECCRVQGKFEEARGFFEQAITLRGKLGAPVAVLAAIWGEIGITWYSQCHLDKAWQSCDRALQLLLKAAAGRPFDSSARRTWAHLHCGQSVIRWREGNYTEARRLALEALRIYEEREIFPPVPLPGSKRYTRIQRTLRGDPLDLGRTYRLLWLIEASSGHASEALHYLEAAQTIFKHYESLRDLAIIGCDLGEHLLYIASFEEARHHLVHAQNLAERIGDRSLLAYLYANMALVFLREGQLGHAQEYIEQAVQNMLNLNDPASSSLFLSCHAAILLERNDLSRAKEALLHAFLLARSIAIPSSRGVALLVLGRLRLFLADNNSQLLKRAKNTLSHALRLRGVEIEYHIEGQILLAQTYLLLGEYEQAHHLSTEAYDRAYLLERPWLAACAQRVLASICHKMENIELAVEHLERALHIFHQHGMHLEEERTRALAQTLFTTQTPGAEQWIQGDYEREDHTA